MGRDGKRESSIGHQGASGEREPLDGHHLSQQVRGERESVASWTLRSPLLVLTG